MEALVIKEGPAMVEEPDTVAGAVRDGERDTTAVEVPNTEVETEGLVTCLWCCGLSTSCEAVGPPKKLGFMQRLGAGKLTDEEGRMQDLTCCRTEPDPRSVGEKE